MLTEYKGPRNQWRKATMQEAFEFAQNKLVLKQDEDFGHRYGNYEGNASTVLLFRDGSAVRMNRMDGCELSEYTWESGYVEFEICVSIVQEVS